MLKKLAAVLLSLVAVVSFSAFSNSPSDNPTESKIKIPVSFDAMKELVEAVGRDKVEVSTIISVGMEAHDFEPKAQDLVNLSTAQIFVYNGLGMEGWAEEAISAADNASLIVVDASTGADLIERETLSEDHDEDAHHHEDPDHETGHHHHGKYDPHLWLGLRGAQTQAENIKNALVQADSANKEYYEQNFNAFAAELEKLYKEYSGKFEAAPKKSFVTGHAAFGYLCREFGLEQNSIRDIFAEGEPSAQQLAQLVEYCRENNVTTIFAEEMVSPAVSQTLANEVGAKVEIIYTMENAQDGMTYLERIESNLSKIYDSLTK